RLPALLRWYALLDQLLRRLQLFRPRHVGHRRIVVLEALRRIDQPGEPFKDWTVALSHAHPHRRRSLRAAQRLDLEVDGVERGDGEVVRREGGGAAKRDLGTDGSECDRGDVAAVRSPDLPVAREARTVAPVPALDRRILLEIAHGQSKDHGESRER